MVCIVSIGINKTLSKSSTPFPNVTPKLSIAIQKASIVFPKASICNSKSIKCDSESINKCNSERDTPRTVP